MTTRRRDGGGEPFGEWLRGNKALDSFKCNLYATDIDFQFCKYKTHIDGVGTRSVKLLLEVEVKTFGAKPNPEQLEVLFFRHDSLNSKQKRLSTRLKKPVSVWNFGCSILVMESDRPDTSSYILYGRFMQDGSVDYMVINHNTLTHILAFDIRPDTLTSFSLRRHHKERFLIETVTTPLGIKIDRRVVRRS
ncbi:MAG: hypothetical protein V3W19_04040 [Desulfatiglandales bacterium]